jgi:LysM repeat protein
MVKKRLPKRHDWLVGWLLVSIIIVISACQPSTMSASPTPEGALCGDIQIAHDIACIVRNETLLLQAQTRSIIAHANMRITFTNSIQIVKTDNTWQIGNLGGSLILNLQDSTQIIAEGGYVQVAYEDGNLRLDDRRVFPLYANNIAKDLLAQLPQQVTLPTPVAPPEGFQPPPTATATLRPLTPLEQRIGTFTPEPTVCAPREDWTFEHIIQRGETLSEIAQNYDTSIEALQTGNCLTNIDRIRVGQRLRVPNASDTTQLPTGTPSAVLFRADQNNLIPNNCTMLRWDVLNVSSIYLSVLVDDDSATPLERDVSAINSDAICPLETTTYQLRVVYPDTRETLHTTTVSIIQTTATP